MCNYSYFCRKSSSRSVQCNETCGNWSDKRIGRACRWIFIYEHVKHNFLRKIFTGTFYLKSNRNFDTYLYLYLFHRLAIATSICWLNVYLVNCKKTIFICYANFRTLLFIMCPESWVKHSSPKFASPMLKIQFTLMCWIDNAWASDYLSSLLYILAIGKQVENSIENQRKLLQFVFRVSSKF